MPTTAPVRSRPPRLSLESLEDRTVPSGGQLDPGFAGTGYAINDFGTADDSPRTMAVQPDGKVVVALSVYNGEAESDFALVRYTAAGAVDTSFGVNGVVHTDFNGGPDYVQAITFAPDGDIYAVGSAYTSGGLIDVGVARYNSDGSLDRSFGSRGKATAQAMGGFPEVRDYANAAVVDSAGRLVVAGSSNGHNFDGYHYSNTLYRFTASGALDKSFGKSGKVVSRAELAAGNAWNAVTLVPSGTSYKIAVVGRDNRESVLARFTASGSRDGTLGGGTGEVALSGGGPGMVEFVPGGGGAFVGVRGENNTVFTVFRYGADGTLSSSTSVDLQPALPSNAYRTELRDIAVDASGRVVMAGSVYTTDDWVTGFEDSLVVRLTPDGALDANFGTGGVVYDAFSPERDGLSGIAVDPVTGIIVTAGYADIDSTASDLDLLVSRRLSD
jgi:uncharacterized delta-60 repeat protein